jgi:hypothetical protein
MMKNMRTKPRKPPERLLKRQRLFRGRLRRFQGDPEKGSVTTEVIAPCGFLSWRPSRGTEIEVKDSDIDDTDPTEV